MGAEQDWLVDKIVQSEALPTHPSSLPYLLDALNDEDTETTDLAEVLERFPGIAARLLSLANSAWAAPVETISSIERACVQLGLSLVKSVSISLAVASPFDPNRCPTFHSERFWCDAFLIAECAERLARHSDTDLGDCPGTLRTAGLMHNLGLLWIADNLPLEAEQALTRAGSGEVRLRDALIDICGTDACEVGGLIGRAWDLPEDLVASMEQHVSTDYAGGGWQIATLVGLSIGIVRELNGNDPDPDDGIRLDRLEIGASERGQVRSEVAKRLESTRELTQNLRV